MEINDTQIELYLNKLDTALSGLADKQITVWGVTFKSGTDDLRSSPAIALIKRLVQMGCRVHTYDPMVKLELDDVYSYNDQ